MEKIKIELSINGEIIPCVATIDVSRDGTFEIAALESAPGAKVEGTDLTGLLTIKDVYDSIEFQIVNKKAPGRGGKTTNNKEQRCKSKT